MSGARLSIAWRGRVCALALPSLVMAQGQTPDFTAPPGSARVETSPVYSAPLPVDSGQVAQDAVDIFRRTCLASVGDAGALVDLALGAGLAPNVGGPEGDTSTAGLLGDAPGQVYGVPGSSDVLLAIGDDGRCTVWASRTDGPKLKQAFVAAIDAMREGGATVKPVRDRTVQRGGGWRQQIGYEVSDTRGAFSADAVTLLTPQPGTQVLRAAPSGRRSAAKDVPQPAASKPTVAR